MRRGKWLFHYDSYREQSPVFQVKNNPVRITASLEIGLYPQIQVLVGDNPNDPSAIWVGWRKNNQELRLGADEATQTVIAAAGWYRLDTDDLIGTKSMVWVEDEEGTLDRVITPMTMLRPACGEATQPPIVDPIDVTCLQLRDLLNAASLQAGRWYRVSDIMPGQLDGQPFLVYLQALEPNRIEWAGWLECEPYTQNGRLWPCHVVFWPDPFTLDRCWLEWVHDLRHQNWLRGLNTIMTWPFASSTFRGNRVEFGQFSLPDGAPSVLFSNNVVVGSRFDLRRGAIVQLCDITDSSVALRSDEDGAPQMVRCTLAQRALVELTGQYYLSASELVGGTVRGFFGAPLLDRPYTKLVTISNSRFFNSILDVDGVLFGGRSLSIERMDLFGNSRVLLRQFCVTGGFVSHVHDVSLRGQSVLDGVLTGLIYRLRLSDTSIVRIDGTYLGRVPGVNGCQFSDVELRTSSSLTVRSLQAVSYVPIIDNLTLSDQAVFDALNVWQLYVQATHVKTGSLVQLSAPTGQSLFGVGFRNSTIADRSVFSVSPSGGPLAFIVTDSTFSSYSVQPVNAGGRIELHQFDGGSGGLLRYARGTFTARACMQKGGVLYFGQGLCEAHGLFVKDASVAFSAAANLGITNNRVEVRDVSVVDRSTLRVQNATNQTNNTLLVSGVNISGGSSIEAVSVAGSGSATLQSTAVAAGASHIMQFTTAAAKTVSGLYSHGNIVHFSVWPASFTGTNTRNF